MRSPLVPSERLVPCEHPRVFSLKPTAGGGWFSFPGACSAGFWVYLGILGRERRLLAVVAPGRARDAPSRECGCGGEHMARELEGFYL